MSCCSCRLHASHASDVAQQQVTRRNVQALDAENDRRTQAQLALGSPSTVAPQSSGHPHGASSFGTGADAFAELRPGQRSALTLPVGEPRACVGAVCPQACCSGAAGIRTQLG